MTPSKHLILLKQWLPDLSQSNLEAFDIQGGFSGAKIWRVSTPSLDLCLRRWPQNHPSFESLANIHGLLTHVHEQGDMSVPVPLRTRKGDSYFVHENHLWELTPWMPGEANYLSHPNIQRLRAAMHTLAHFHKAALSYKSQIHKQQQDYSPGLLQRHEILVGLQKGEFDNLWSALQKSDASELRTVAIDILKSISSNLSRVIAMLERISHIPLPMQWCIRDVKHDHVLFTENRVTGLIDFGAAAVDSVSGDIARLLGSMVNENREDWEYGIQAYSQIRSLSQEEVHAIEVFKDGGVIVASVNWIRWLFLEGKSFPRLDAVLARLAWLRNRLNSMPRG